MIKKLLVGLLLIAGYGFSASITGQLVSPTVSQSGTLIFQISQTGLIQNGNSGCGSSGSAFPAVSVILSIKSGLVTTSNPAVTGNDCTATVGTYYNVTFLDTLGNTAIGTATVTGSSYSLSGLSLTITSASNPSSSPILPGCLGEPGNTPGAFRQLCQSPSGNIYACNNPAFCSLASQWVLNGGGSSALQMSGNGLSGTVVASTLACGTNISCSNVGGTVTIQASGTVGSAWSTITNGANASTLTMGSGGSLEYSVGTIDANKYLGTAYTIQGTDTSLITSGTISGGAGTAICLDGNSGITTSSCSFANKALSNLSAVSINTGLIPQTTLSLGAATTPWQYIYLYGSAGFGSSDYWQLGVGTPTGARQVTFPDATDTVVELTQTQTLTNKTVDGVTPTTFGYVDPTSSIQTQLNSKAPTASPTFTGTLSASGATHTTPTIVVTSAGSLPATCTTGELGFVTSATAGQQIYECSSTNTWIQQLNSGSGGGANTALSNLSAVSINTGLIPQTTLSLGAASTPWQYLYLYGSASFGANNYWQLGVGAPTGARQVTFPDASDTVVELTQTQTLTNKTVDGVTPTTFGYVDPTSSIQTQLNAKAPSASPTFTGTVNSSGATHTEPVIVVASLGSLPATCTTGELGFVTGATAGQQIYECSATNTWTQQLNSGSGSSPNTNVVTASSSTFNFGAIGTYTAYQITLGATVTSSTCPTGTPDNNQLLEVQLIQAASGGPYSFTWPTCMGTGPSVPTEASAKINVLWNWNPTTSAYECANCNSTTHGIGTEVVASSWNTPATGLEYSGFDSATNRLVTKNSAGNLSGGVFDIAAVSHEWIYKVVGGVPSLSQPGLGDLSNYTIVASAASLPATCNAGDLGFVTSATPGQNIYECTSGNAWTQQLNSGGGGSLPSCSTGQGVYFASGGTTGSCLTFGSGLTLTAGTLTAAAGNVNNAAQYDVTYYSGSGTTNTLSGAAVNGIQFDSTSGAPTAATASNVISLFSGCSGTQYLGADGNCHTASGSGTVTTSGSPTTNYYALFTGSTVIGNGHIDDGVTTTGTVTVSDPFATSTYVGLGGHAPTSSFLVDVGPSGSTTVATNGLCFAESTNTCLYSSTGQTISTNGNQFSFIGNGTITAQASNGGLIFSTNPLTTIKYANRFTTSSQMAGVTAAGDTGAVQTGVTFNPASQTTTFAGYAAEDTITQSGTATGITRGFWANDAVTNAYDYRSLVTAGGARNLIGSTIVANTQDVLFGIPTYSATSSAQTLTTASTVKLSGVPTASTNVTITSAYGLYVPASAATSGTTNAYDIFLVAPTGATNNYSIGGSGWSVDGSGNLIVAGCTGCGSGSGTVTSFSAGSLSPLFTTSVATATSTPALTFSLSNAAAYTVFGNATSSSAAPGFTTNPAVASVILEGSSSGSATLSVTSTGGTVNLGSTNATVDSSGNGTFNSVSTGGGKAGTTSFVNSSTPGTVVANSWGWTAPATITTSWYGEAPNAVPTSSQIMVFGPPSSNVSQWVWTTFSSTNLTDTANLVYNNAANAFTSAGSVNLSSSTVADALRAPVKAGFTSGATGSLGYDSTNSNYHGYNGADSIFGVFPTASVPTTGHAIYATVSSSKVTLTDAGYAYNSIPNADLSNSAITIGGVSVSLGLSTSSFPSPGPIGGTTPAAITGTTITANTSLAINGGTAVTSELGTDTKFFTASGSAAGNGNVITGDAQGGIVDSGTNLSALAPLNSPGFTGTPTAPTQATGNATTDIATTLFVSNAVAASNPATAVLAATTGSNLTGTYSNGASGIGATFTITATGAFTLDGVAINTIGQRVLLKDQTSTFQNGVYTATTVGTTGVSAVFTRATDYNQPSDINSTGPVFVQSGTANATTSWLLTSTVATIGTDAITYAQATYAPANLVTAASNFTSGDLVQAAASNKTTSDSGIATSNVVTQTSNASSGQVCTYTGTNKVCVPASVAPSNASGNTSGSGNFCLTTSCVMTTPNVGAAAATSLLATGIVDGQAPVTVTTTSSATLGGTYKSGYTLNQEATAGTAVTYTLPTAAAGLQYCVANSYNGSAANTGTLEILTSASGQFIIFTDGTLSATGGYVISGGAARDSACVVGIDSTHWMLYPSSGTWTKH